MIISFEAKCVSQETEMVGSGDWHNADLIPDRPKTKKGSVVPRTISFQASDMPLFKYGKRYTITVREN